MSENIEKRLRRLESIEEIKQLIARYAKACDLNGDAAMLSTCFTQDVVWNCKEVGHWEGRDSAVKGIHESCTVKLPWALHYMTQPVIDVDDDGICTWDDFTASISATLLIPEITTSEPLDILLVRSPDTCD